MKMLRLFCCFLIVSLTTSISVIAQDVTMFRQAAQEALEAYDTPGFAVGVIKDGEIVLSEGFGTRTIGRDEPVDGNTLFAIASNTKAFISTAITRLHEEGQLDLDDPVQQYLPYFELYDEYVSQHTTVRDLLCHRVGLGTFSGDALWYKSTKTPEEIIKQIKHLPAAYDWRGGYGYTNLMFITAGEVIKAVTGMSWDQYVQTHFLDPLDMTRTQTEVAPLGTMTNIATPHVTQRDNLPIDMAQWNTPGAAGGIISSTNDMLKWLGAQLDPEASEERDIFPAAARHLAMRPHTPIGGLNFYSAGLGWFLYRRGNQAIVTHGGGYDGMYSIVILIPEQHIGIVILTNSMTGLSSRLGNYIRDTYLGINTEGWLQDAKEAEVNASANWQAKFDLSASRREASQSATLDHDQLVGTYHDPLYGDITISSEDNGSLQLAFEQAPELNASLTHWHYDTYQIDWHHEHAWFDFGTVQFVLDNNRIVNQLRFDVPNDDIFFHELHPVKIE